MQKKILIKEIFTSIQGEGPYIGFNQLFIRFSKCNLNCIYCDTDFKTNLKEYTADELKNIVNTADNIHSVSLTGGEPLMDVDFLEEFLPLVNKKIYLETNGTLFHNLEKVISFIDIISMDVKLDSVSSNGEIFDRHENFIKIAVQNKKEIFLKIVFDSNITDEEIEKSVKLAEKYKLLIVLQPKMDGMILNLSADEITRVFAKFTKKYENVRLIPQVHKFINVE